MLGVDGGNTKTLAAVAGTDGVTRGVGRGACSDLYGAETPERAIDAIVAAVAEALAHAGVVAAEIEAAAFSLAGADWPEDFALLERALRERLELPVAPLIVNDAMGALRAGSADWTGVSIVAGTHNAVGARAADGRVFHLGFWPDGAGGRDLAGAGLRAVYNAALGIGPPTTLSQRALALFDADDAIALLHAFTRRGGLARAEADRLAPVVLDEADAGDAVARAIVEDKGGVLGRQGRACAQRVGLELDGTTVVLAGRVFGHPSDRLAAATTAELPGVVVVRDAAPPIAGAVLLALDQLGVAADAETVAAGLPSSASEGRSARWARSPSRA